MSILIITIIILLILAGITIVQLTRSGMFDKAKASKLIYNEKLIEENEIIESYINELSKINSGRDENNVSGKFIRRYSTTSAVKNNKKSSITINDLTVGENYFMVLVRATTGGSNGYIAGGTPTFSNMTCTKVGSYVYNFTPTNSSVTVTFGTNTESSSYGGWSYIFLFEGSLEEPAET